MSPENNLQPWKVMIIDDDQGIHDVTKMILRRMTYEERPIQIIQAYSAAEALVKLIEHNDIAVALLDVVMEEDSSGLDLVKTIREDLNNSSIRLIIRTGNPGLAPEDSVTLDYDINDYQSKTDLTALKLKTIIITALRSFKSLITIKKLNQELDSTQKELIYTLGEIAESRSMETGHHVKRVGLVTALIAEKMGFSKKEVELLEMAASMHDLGKLAIDDRILNKPGKLTKQEFEQMKNHSLYGYTILKHSTRELLTMASIIAYEHHEDFNGNGYPRQLKGDEINLFSRIVSVVDVFDALATKRIYKSIWPQDKIIQYLKEQKGIKFDPEIVDILLDNLDEINDLIKDLM